MMRGRSSYSKSRLLRVRPRRVIPRGLLVIGLLLALVVFALYAYNGIPFKGYKTLYVKAPAVGNLEQHDDVRLAGQRVGQVRGLSITKDGEALLKLQIEPSTPTLPVGTTVEIRAAGLLGARFLQLIPGHSSRKLPFGSTISVGPNAKTFGIPELLKTFDQPTRVELGNMTRGLGLGLLGNGVRLNNGLQSAAPEQVPFQQIVASLLSRPGAVEQFLPSTNSALAPLDQARSELTAMFAPTSAAIRPFADRAASVKALFDQAPSALSEANSGLGHGETLLNSTASLARSINGTLPEAPAALTAATRLLQDGPRTLPQATKLLQAVNPAVPAVLRITRSLNPVLTPTSQALNALDPLLNRLGQYRCDVVNFAAVFRSMTGFASPGPNGPNGQFRLQVIPSPVENFDTGSQLAPKLVHFDPYPAPCEFTGPASVTDPLGSGPGLGLGG